MIYHKKEEKRAEAQAKRGHYVRLGRLSASRAQASTTQHSTAEWVTERLADL